MSKIEAIDARHGDHVRAPGNVLKQLIRQRIVSLRDAHVALVKRMNLEMPDKETAITLMVTMAGEPSAMNERALFFQACVDRCAFLEKEMAYLNTVGQTFDDHAIYMVTVEDAQRFGL